MHVPGSSRTREKFYRRAESSFERSTGDLEEAIAVMLADRSAQGRLRGGMTILAALGIFEERSRATLDKLLSEAASLIDHRGGKWNQAMLGISGGLQEHLSRGPDLVSKAIGVAASARSPSAEAAVGQEFAAISARLEGRLADFRDGWTAPVAKPWPDRHRFIYAVALLAIGALVAAVVKAVFSGARVPLP